MNQFRFSRRPDIGDKVSVSFEFFPPKTDEMRAHALMTTVADAARHCAPNFVSVTYGAGGSTRERTHSTVRAARGRDRADTGRASDLRRRHACREVDAVIRNFTSIGIKQFVALRGDPAAGVGAALPPASRRLRQRRRTGRRR